MAPRAESSLEQRFYEILLKNPDGMTLPQVIGQHFSNTGLKEGDFQESVNSLLRATKLKVLNLPDGTHLFRAIEEDRAARTRGLTQDEQLVYQVVKESGRNGIWTRDIKRRTNIPQYRVTKMIKNLEDRLLIKHVKSFQNASRKTYILSELEPTREVTGGPWYGPDSFDSEFVDALREIAWTMLMPYGRGGVSLDVLYKLIEDTDAIKDKGIVTLDDLGSLLGSMEMDGLVERVADRRGTVFYRPATSQRPASALATVPCGLCPLTEECSAEGGGKISPENCVYYNRWLNDELVEGTPRSIEEATAGVGHQGFPAA